MSIRNKKSFGKGLEDILSTAKNISTDDDRLLKSINVPLTLIQSGQYQPRKHFDEGSLSELSSSIKEHGVLQPILVRKVNNSYEIIAGERRWRASLSAGIKNIPCIICNVDDDTVRLFGLIENIQRDDLNPIEEATALKTIIEVQQITHEKAAELVGKSRPRISNLMRLLALNKDVIELVRSYKIEMGHARALLRLDTEQQYNAAIDIINKSMSVREAETYISNLVNNKSKIEASGYEQLLERCANLEAQFSLNIEGKVSIKPRSGNKVCVSIVFESIEDADDFCTSGV